MLFLINPIPVPRDSSICALSRTWVGSVGRLAGAWRDPIRVTSAALQVSPRLESGQAGRVRSVRLLLVDGPSALRAPGKQCSEQAAPRALVEARQGGQEPWASRFHA